MPIFLKDNHQLESRMREIRQSGSEGGAKRTFVPTPIIAWAVRPRECEVKASSAEGAEENGCSTVASNIGKST
jgi:hypothetical protein